MHRSQASSFATLLVLLVSIASFVSSLEFWASDACVDAGGAYRSLAFQCAGVASSYQQIWARPWASWLLVLVFPVYITLCAVVTRSVALTGAYSILQKATQLALLWLVPIAGLVLVGWFARQGIAPLPRTPNDPYPREQQLPD